MCVFNKNSPNAVVSLEQSLTISNHKLLQILLTVYKIILGLFENFMTKQLQQLWISSNSVILNEGQGHSNWYHADELVSPGLRESVCNFEKEANIMVLLFLSFLALL